MPDTVDADRITKVSANFLATTVAAMDLATELTGDNNTDVINRAVQLYAYVMRLEADGKLVFVEHPATGSRERLVLL